MNVKSFFNRRWWWTTLLMIAGIVVLIRLGFWQLDRLEQRRARNAATFAQLEAAPLSLNEWGEPAGVLATMEDRRVSAEGRYDFERQILLNVQYFNNQPGGHLVTPLLLEGSDRAVLVDRGWLPEAELDAVHWPDYDEPGVVGVTGFIQPSETLDRAVGNGDPAGVQSVWYRVDVAAIEAQLPYELLPVYVVAAPPAGEGDAAGLLRSEPEIDLSEGPHLSYAIQWFLFSLMLGGGYVYYVHKNAN